MSRVGVYVIQDRLSGVFSEPIFRHNDDVMLRYFKSICDNAPEAQPCDYDLYCIGLYDSEKACFSHLEERPFFVANGASLYKKVGGSDEKTE